MNAPPAEPVLVTGAAGFIGFAFARHLLEVGRAVVGVDSLNDYYDPALKEARLARLRVYPGFTFHRLDLADRTATEQLFADGRFSRVVHLAAQAGVRYSLLNPHAYLDANLAGFLNLLEGCRHAGTPHLLYASSSSVYGANTRLPFSVHDNVDHPISLYAATKKANELMAHAYSRLYGLPATGLRFFTVYGPWYRPDMALFIFTKAILEGRPIRLFNQGRSGGTSPMSTTSSLRWRSSSTIRRGPIRAGRATLPTRPRARRRGGFTISATIDPSKSPRSSICLNVRSATRRSESP